MDPSWTGNQIAYGGCLLLYFAPAIIGAIRWIRSNFSMSFLAPLALTSLLNLFLGWTIIGWFAALIIALRRHDGGRYESVPGDAGQVVHPIWGTPDTWPPCEIPPDMQPIWDRADSQPSCETSGTQPTWQIPGTQPAWQMPVDSNLPEPDAPCDRCGGQGEVCRRCHGNRGQYERPQGETGASTWVSCTYCNGLGRVQCTLCGKTPYG